MKNLLSVLVLAALFLSVTTVAAENPKKADAEAKLARVEQARDELARKLNVVTWESYFDWAKRTDNMADMAKFKGIRLRSLCDTVPELKVLWTADSTTYARWQEILRTDPEYESIHDEYISLKGIKDKTKTDANSQRYNLMYDRLWRNNPDYTPARDAKNASRRLRDEAIARYLFDYYRAQGKVFPTDDVIPYAQMRTLRAEYPVIVDMEQELAVLNKLQKELREQFLRELYGVEPPADDGRKGPVRSTVDEL